MNDKQDALERLVHDIAQSSFESDVKRAWKEYVCRTGMPHGDDYIKAVLRAHRNGTLTWRKARTALDVMHEIDPAWLDETDAA